MTEKTLPPFATSSGFNYAEPDDSHTTLTAIRSSSGLFYIQAENDADDETIAVGVRMSPDKAMDLARWIMEQCAASEIAPKWTPVDERLPEMGTVVLAIHRDKHLVGPLLYAREGFISRLPDSNVVHRNIAFWQPFAAPGDHLSEAQRSAIPCNRSDVIEECAEAVEGSLKERMPSDFYAIVIRRLKDRHE